MKKVVGLLFALSLFLMFTARVHAAVVISEIMYDFSGTDTNHEWVEIENTGDSTIDITGWKFNDGSNHTLNVPPSNGGTGSMSIPAGGFAILSGNASIFLTDNPSFSGTVIDTVMSLNNTGDTLKLFDTSGAEVADATYTSDMGAAGDGNSLQKSGSTYVAAVPTPGAAFGGADTSSGGTGGGGITTTVSSETPISKTVTPKAVIHIPRTLFVGAPFRVSGTVTDEQGSSINSGYFVFTMGDGAIKDMQTLVPFSYTYQYPGDYVVDLDYYTGWHESEPTITTSITVHVVATQVLISHVYPNGGIELKNTSSFDTDLGGYKLIGDTTTFVFPRHTIVLAGKTIVIAPSVTGFDFTTAQKSVLSTPTDQQVVVDSTEIVSKKIKNTTSYQDTFLSGVTKKQRSSMTSSPGDTAALQANAITANIVPSLWVWVGICGLLLLVLIGIFIYIKNIERHEREQIGISDEVDAFEIEE